MSRPLHRTLRRLTNAWRKLRAEGFRFEQVPVEELGRAETLTALFVGGLESSGQVLSTRA